MAQVKRTGSWARGPGLDLCLWQRIHAPRPPGPLAKMGLPDVVAPWNSQGLKGQSGGLGSIHGHGLKGPHSVPLSRTGGDGNSQVVCVRSWTAGGTETGQEGRGPFCGLMDVHAVTCVQ